MKAIFLVVPVWLSLSMAATAAQCPYSGATYLTPDSRFSIRFVKVPRLRGQVSDLGLRVRDEHARKDVVYYYFDEGSAPRITLISTTNVSLAGWRANPDGGVRPHGAATFIGLDPNGHIDQTAPSSEASAPRFVIIPELGEVLKNSGISFLRNDAFIRTSCSQVTRRRKL